MGEGSRPQHNKKQQPRKLHNTKGGTQRPKRRQSQKRRQKHQQKNTTQRSHSKRGTEEKTKNKQRPRKARPKTSKNRSLGGERTTKRRAKDPTKQQQWEQITTQYQGISGTWDRTGQKKAYQVKGRGDKKGIATSRLERRQDSASPALRHEAAVHHIWPERLLYQSPAFSYAAADREIPVLAHVAWLLEHSD